jgi:hypothetical protein
MASLSLIDAASRTTMAKRKNWMKKDGDAKDKAAPDDKVGEKKPPFGKEERRKRLYGKSKD